MKNFLKRLIPLMLVLVIAVSSVFIYGCSNNPSSGTDQPEIKNVIFMIPDGGGFDSFTLADQVKETLFSQGKDKLVGARTTLSKDALSEYGYNDVTGLYLNEFLVGAVSTDCYDDDNPDEFRTTDSSAAGTALATGQKTVYKQAGIDKNRKPIASLTELSQSKEKSTGIVTTKSFVDATPLAFFSGHSVDRREYQDISYQALTSGVDVLLAEGTEYGDLVKDGTSSSHPDTSASALGYTVVKTKDEMNSAVESGATKLWGSISGMNHNKYTPTQLDNTSNVLPYDVDSTATTPTLLDMTKAALTTLSTNINNENGFFLMVEGGALDNAAESGRLRYSIGEALAFDETFAYCVKWAKEHGDNTMIVAVADHDSGGFYGIENYKDALMDLIINGHDDITPLKDYAVYKTLVNAGSEMKLKNVGHTSMPVPISIYAPESVKGDMLAELGLPDLVDGVRYADKPQYYCEDSVNNDYLIENTKIAPAIATVAELGSFEDLSSEMFVEVAKYNRGKPQPNFNGLGTLTFGTKHVASGYVYQEVTFTSNDGSLVVKRNAFDATLNGNTTSLGKSGNKQFRALFILNTTDNYDNDSIYQSGTFYLPKSILQQAGIIA